MMYHMVLIAKTQSLVQVGDPPRYAPGHKISLSHDVGFAPQGFYQPKGSAWVTQSHYHSALLVTLKLFLLWVSLHEGGDLIPHTLDTAPHQERRVTASKATTPSLKGVMMKTSSYLYHQDTRSTHPNHSQSSHVLRPKPHNDPLYIVSILAMDVILKDLRGWMECRNTFSKL